MTQVLGGRLARVELRIRQLLDYSLHRFDDLASGQLGPYAGAWPDVEREMLLDAFPVKVDQVGVGEVGGIAVGGGVHRVDPVPLLDQLAAELNVLERNADSKVNDTEDAEGLLDVGRGRLGRQ